MSRNAIFSNKKRIDQGEKVNVIKDRQNEKIHKTIEKVFEWKQWCHELVKRKHSLLCSINNVLMVVYTSKNCLNQYVAKLTNISQSFFLLMIEYQPWKTK